MRKKVLQKFLLLEKSKRMLLEWLEGMPQSTLNQSSETGGWSIAQIVYHMYMVEKFSLQYMVKKTGDLTQLSSSGIKEGFKSALLSVSLALPIKYRAPKIVSDGVPENVDWEPLIKDWAEVRVQLHQFINQLPDEALALTIFKHPRTGLMTLNQTLKFYQSHFDHHLPQIKNHSSKSTSA